MLVLARKPEEKVIITVAGLKIEVTVVASDNGRAKLRLLANDSVEIHPFIAKKSPLSPVTFDIPKEAVSSGELTLTWYQEPGKGGAGQVVHAAVVVHDVDHR